MTILDFYSDSAGFVIKLAASLSNCQQELTDVLKPHDNVMSTLLEAEILDSALKLYRQVQSFLAGQETESQGH